jgi:peptide/nickel transport system permease protein
MGEKLHALLFKKGGRMNSAYIIRKVLRALLTVWLVTTFVFLILRLSGDPTVSVLGLEASPEAVEAFRAKWGLNDSVGVQYLTFVKNALHGDLGLSILEGTSALKSVTSRMFNTITLMTISTALIFVVGISFGLLASLYHNSYKDRFIMLFAVAGYSIPTFVLAVLLILLFSIQLGWLPSTGSGSWTHYVMPVMTLTIVESAVFARFSRSAMLEVLYQPYMKTAMAKGLTWRQAVRRHALPNAAIPVVTIMGFWVGLLIAGAVITESIFGWPGVGRLLVFSVKNRDYNVVQVIVLFISCSMVMANLAVDLLYGWLDPRISIEKRNV